MNIIFSEKEQTIRKWWLRIFLFTCIYSYFMFIATPANHVAAGYVGLAIDLLMKIALYYFGYRKMGTRWLTANIWLSGVGLIILFLFVLGSMIGQNAMIQAAASGFWATTVKIGLVRSMIAHVLSLAFLFANIQLRKINKARRKPPRITIVSA